MIAPSRDKLKIEQLEARIRFHLHTAEYFDLRHEPGMARKFRDMAGEYQAEIDRRAKGAAA